METPQSLLLQALARARAQARPLWLLVDAPWSQPAQVWRQQVLTQRGVIDAAEGWPRLELSCSQWPALDDAAQFTAQVAGAVGGWPLCLFLDPGPSEALVAPLFAVTAPDARSLEQVLRQLQVAWTLEATALRERAQQERQHMSERDLLRRRTDPNTGSATAEDLATALTRLWTPLQQSLAADALPARDPLFHYPAAWSAALREPAWRPLAFTALAALAQSPVHDVLGGGFFRSLSLRSQAQQLASEKLLEENAAYLLLYARAFALSGNAFFAQTAASLARCLWEDFYSAQTKSFAGALSAAPRFYEWSAADLLEALPGPQRQAAALFFGIGAAPRVPHFARDLADLARELGCEPVDLQNLLFEGQGRLLKARCARTVQPQRHTATPAVEAGALRALLLAEPLLQRALSGEESDSWRGRALQRLESLCAFSQSQIHADPRTAAALARACFAAFHVSGFNSWRQRAQSFLKLMAGAQVQVPWLGERFDARDHLGESALAQTLQAQLDAWLADGRDGSALPQLQVSLHAVLPLLRPLGLMGGGVYDAVARYLQLPTSPTYY